MNENYFTSFTRFFLFLFFVNSCNLLNSQDLNLITLKDYNLKGKVQHCIVSADYGNEEFYFDRDGILTKSITRYGEEDYTITAYAIQDKTLIQKNIEVYNNGELDKSVSLAHAYEIRINSHGKIITERIVNFKNEVFDTYKYVYDKDNRLIKITRNNDKGISETDIVYETDDKGKIVKEVHLAGVDTIKVIKKLTPKIDHHEGAYEKLETMYANNQPDMAHLRFIDSTGKVMFEEKLQAGNKNPYRYYSNTKKTYVYNKNGDIIEEREYRKGTLLKKFIYEYEYEDFGKDTSKPVNWIRKTEKNSKNSITREIEYFSDKSQ